MSNYRIEIVKYREHKDSVYCGRGNVYGNPFPMDTKHSRDDVCNLYENYFKDKVQYDPSFLIALKKLHDKGKKEGILKLGCFC